MDMGHHMTLQDAERFFQQLHQSIPSVDNALFSTRDGLLIGSTFAIDNTDEIAAITAAFRIFSERAFQGLAFGACKGTVLQGERALYVIVGVDDHYILGLQAKVNINQAYLFEQIDKALQKNLSLLNAA